MKHSRRWQRGAQTLDLLKKESWEDLIEWMRDEQGGLKKMTLDIRSEMPEDTCVFLRREDCGESEAEGKREFSLDL